MQIAFYTSKFRKPFNARCHFKILPRGQASLQNCLKVFFGGANCFSKSDSPSRQTQHCGGKFDRCRTLRKAWFIISRSFQLVSGHVFGIRSENSTKRKLRNMAFMIYPRATGDSGLIIFNLSVNDVS